MSTMRCPLLICGVDSHDRRTVLHFHGSFHYVYGGSLALRVLPLGKHLPTSVSQVLLWQPCTNSHTRLVLSASKHINSLILPFCGAMQINKTHANMYEPYSGWGCFCERTIAGGEQSSASAGKPVSQRCFCRRFCRSTVHKAYIK